MTDPSRNRRVDVRLRSTLEAGRFPKDLLVEGPAGTGKTFGILLFVHNLASQFPGFRALLCRQTRASLTESVLVTFEEEVLPAFGHAGIAVGQQRKHRSDYRYPNGSRVVLGGLDKPERILSTAWDVVFINEAIESREDAWETFRSRMGRPGRDHRFGHLIGDTNPGDPSHWLNRRCDEGRTVRWQTGHAANPALFGHGGWTAAWDTFRESLDSLTGSRRKRFFDGVWAAGEGAWFTGFDPGTHVSAAAEFDPRWPVHLAIDTGPHTGAVLYQVRGDGPAAVVTVFSDHYSYEVPAFDTASAILAMLVERCQGRFDVGRYDPAGGARLGFGAMTIVSEYQRAGLVGISPWTKGPGSILAGLNLLDSFITSKGAFLVHPRCVRVVAALTNYRRKKKSNQFIDEPEDDQHPHGEIVDALRSSLLDRFPEGRKPAPKFRHVRPGQVF